jgi:bifunctional non-homologous end joining protein LigD
VPSCQKLQGRMHLRNPADGARAAKVSPVTYMAFDLLYLDGRDLTSLPLRERRELLEQTVVPGVSVQVSPTVTGEGTVLYEAAVAQALEGIVAKRLDARYEPGARSRWWLKIKTVLEADVVVLGWREGAGNRAGTIGSLVLGVYDGDRLRYVGNVGTGFNRESLATVAAALEDLVQPGSPLDAEERRQVPSLRTTHWVEPKLVAQVEYRQLTEGGRLRAPSFRGLRTDKRPDECRFEDL